jgi:uncharacterized surface protein with fasciclin (FAS1) repeats
MKKLSLLLGFLIFMNVAFATPRLSTDIVDTAVGAGSFTTLVTALKAANLVATLKGPGPFTVFAPTDEAFNKLPPGTVEALLNNIPLLTEVLTYHVVAGEVDRNELVSIAHVKTLQGQFVNVREYSRGKGSDL